MIFTDRISILEHCNREYKDGIAVEVGVAGGHFTKQILKSWPTLAHLYAVDAWKHFDAGYADSCNLPQEEQDKRFAQVTMDLKDEPRAIIIRDLSVNAAKLFGDESISFLYLDANHSTKAVTEDLEAWYPKIKRWGMIAGHDYEAGNQAGYGVKKAVDDFCAKLNLDVTPTIHEFCRPSGIYGACWEGCSFVILKR